MKKIFFLALGLVGILTTSQVKIIAHRGFWKTKKPTSENSIQSLKNAQKLGVYGSEFDVRMTKDKVLVINHDEKINDLEIYKSRYRKLKNILLSNGETLPLLEDYLEQGRQNPAIKMILEIKPAESPKKEDEIVKKTLDLVEQHQMNNQVIFISFSLNICKTIKKTNPKLHVQYLNGDLSPKEIKTIGLDGIDYEYEVFLKNPTWISEAKKLNLVTNTWTINDIKLFKNLKDLGIEFVTTDTPDVFMQNP
ncbi:MAG: glycerophosphodiester phosphodiesterase [Bergeyella sp.]|nr:glycerophosphodiester phosphodiesterase [Bergeyella sp.]